MPITLSDPLTTQGSNSEQLSLYLIDDDPQIRETLSGAVAEFGFQLQAFSDAHSFLRVLDADEIACVIMDLRMPEMGGVDLIRHLNARDCCSAVILLTDGADVPTVVDAMKTGAVSVVEKPVKIQKLIKEIQAAFRVSEHQQSRRSQLQRAKIQLAKLTADEIAVLDLAIGGTPNRQIADVLAISPRTVDRRRSSALQKIGADSVSEYAVLKTITRLASQSHRSQSGGE